MRDRHAAWRGLRWTLWRQVISSPDETSAAYGEVVWFWRRDRGVHPARPCWFGNCDNKRRSPGRARISRQTSRGESRRGRFHLWWFARVLRHAGCPRASAHGIYGRIRRPAFPAPSALKGDDEFHQLGRNRVARMQTLAPSAQIFESRFFESRFFEPRPLTSAAPERAPVAA